MPTTPFAFRKVRFETFDGTAVVFTYDGPVPDEALVVHRALAAIGALLGPKFSILVVCQLITQAMDPSLGPGEFRFCLVHLPEEPGDVMQWEDAPCLPQVLERFHDVLGPNPVQVNEPAPAEEVIPSQPAAAVR